MVTMLLDTHHIVPTAASKALGLAVRQTRFVREKSEMKSSPHQIIMLFMAGGREVGNGGVWAHERPS
jgi:hypothetical protein